MKELEKYRIEIALTLLRKGKISKKTAWKMSGLSYYEFLKKMADQKITETVSDETAKKELEDLNRLNYKELLKTTLEEIKKPLL